MEKNSFNMKYSVKAASGQESARFGTLSPIPLTFCPFPASKYMKVFKNTFTIFLKSQTLGVTDLME